MPATMVGYFKETLNKTKCVCEFDHAWTLTWNVEKNC